MMETTPKPGYVIALHPTSRGLGWIVLEGPFSPHDWGTTRADRGDRNAHHLAHVEKLLARYEPETIVLEAFERRHSARADRIARLGRAVVAMATDRSIDVAIYTRGEVKACFASVGAVSRQDVAEAVARSIPALAHKVPKPRRAWESDNPRLGLFAAAALALTHYQYQATRLLDDLSYSEVETGED